MPDWMNYKLESRLPGEIPQPQICTGYHSNSRKWRGTKEALDEGERKEWKKLALNWTYIKLRSEKAMATHSSTLAWKIPWREEPGRLQSMGSLRVRHDWVTSLSLSTFTLWRRKWQPTPVLLPRESQGRGSLVGCLLWDRTESDMTEVT